MQQQQKLTDTSIPNLAPLPPGFHRFEINKTVWDVPERYTSLTPVGSGAYGQVCKADDSDLKAKVAIKKLARPFQSDIHAKRTYREVRMLKHMDHENIIGLLDIFSPAQSLEDFDDIYLVTQLMGADLNNIIKCQKLTDDHVQFLIYQTLRGLKYVHSAGIIHRDLKPSNLAVNEDCELKILDFGLARQEDDTMTGYVATRWYRAPEIMLNWMHYNSSVDIWSVGCILGELLTGKPLMAGDSLDIWSVGCVMGELMTGKPILPGDTMDIWSVGCILGELLTGKPMFPGSDHIDQLTRIMALVGTPGPELLAKITSEEARTYIRSLPTMRRRDFRRLFREANPLAIDLLERMLDLDPDTRITAEQALAHDYLKQYADSTDEPVSGPYDQSFEDRKLEINEWKTLVYQQIPPPGQPRPIEQLKLML